MAGSVEHMAVTAELLRIDRKRTGCFLNVSDPVHFLLGNLAPDGIMSRKGYVRSMKMHTHFRDGIQDWRFIEPQNLSLFHDRLQQFCIQMLSDQTLDRDLYLGYVTHILTDEIFMKTIRPEFMDKISVLGLTDRDMETFEYFTYDVNQIDFRLGREYPGMNEMQRALSCEDICSIVEMQEIDRGEKNSGECFGRMDHKQDMITAQEMADSRKWVREFFFDHAPEPERPVYYTYDRALRFIEEAVLFIRENIYTYIGEGVR